MLTRRHARRLGALLSLVVMAACASGGGGGDANVSRSDELDIEWTVRLRGGLDLTVEKQVVKSKFVIVRTTDKKREYDQALGMEPLEPIRVGGASFKPGFVINPFKGNGSYEIQAGSPFDAPKQEAENPGQRRSRSSVSVEWYPTGDPTGESFVYLRRAEPCTAKVEDGGNRGRLFCPVHTGEQQDKKFSLEFAWRVV